MASHGGGGGGDQPFFASYDTPQKQTATGIRERQAMAAQAAQDTHNDREKRQHGHGQTQLDYGGRSGGATETDALDTFSSQQFQRTSDSTAAGGGHASGGGAGGGGRQGELAPGYRSPSPPPPTADSRRSYSHNPTASEGYHANSTHDQWSNNLPGVSGGGAPNGAYATDSSGYNHGQYYYSARPGGTRPGEDGFARHQATTHSQQGGYPVFNGQSGGMSDKSSRYQTTTTILRLALQVNLKKSP